MKGLASVTGVTQKILGVISLLAIVSCSNGTPEGRAFITTWSTTESDLSITIPTFQGETYDYTVDWGDGNTDENQMGDAVHEYAEAGEYTVSITGTFPHIYSLAAVEDRNQIIAINQWGDINWSSMYAAFNGCSNLAGQATDTPDLSNVTDMSFMFSGATEFNQNIGDWDTSNVTNMSVMFSGAKVFNQSIGNWNTTNVTNMFSMFSFTDEFDQNIGNWNTSNVTNMAYMFSSAASFNQNISDWDVCKVVGAMNRMSFANGANEFEEDNRPDFNDRTGCPSN